MSELETLSLKLEARGYRVTPSRRAVLASILQRGDHFTVDDLVRHCRGAGRATVFRTIRLLTEMGVVCRVLMEDGSLHYRLSQRGHHHHVVCTQCGSVRDLDECGVGGLVRELAAASGYEIEGHWLEFYGRCLECRRVAEGAGAGAGSK
jgi:Fur family ferric uptake transcriptional regulator